MQVVFRSLLAVMCAAWIASCSLNEHGLGTVDSSHPAQAGAAGAGGATGGTGVVTGTAGAQPQTSGVAGASLAGASGAAGDPSGAAGNTSGAAGDAAGPAGTSGAAGDASSAAGTTGAAGDASGAGGSSSSTGGTGVATTGTGGASNGGAGGSGNAGAAGTTTGEPGCSDGTREGFLDMTKYPSIAACSGAWDTPGLSTTAARSPQCDRRGGNDGDKPDGRGCSVADLCASGWQVCESAQAVAIATMGAGCLDAYAPSGGKPIFFVTLQRATGLVCDTSAQGSSGTNNLYGCGNFGSTADRSCAPFTRMLRDSDCANEYPWFCSDGPLGTSQDEYDVVTKSSSSRGGVLCCKN
jgi:hypothetical protein